MRRPPKMPVVLYTHPFELALGAVLVVNGVRRFVSPSVEALPWLVAVSYLVISTLGGAGVVVGLLLNDRAGQNYERLAAGLTLERAALYLVAAAYAALGVAILGENPGRGSGTALTTLIIGAACILRTVAIRRSAKAVTEALASARHQDTSGE